MPQAISLRDEMDAIDLFIGACGTRRHYRARDRPAGGACGRLGCELLFDSGRQGRDPLPIPCVPSLSHAAAIRDTSDAGALDILRRQREQSTAFASLPALDKDAKVCVYVELDCDDEAQATEELYHLGWVLELAGGRDDATWVAHRGRSRVPAVLPPRGARERQHAYRRASPHRPHHHQAGLRTCRCPMHAFADVVALYRRTLAESGLESAAWGQYGNNHLHVNILAARCAGLPSRWRAVCPVGCGGNGYGRCRFCRARRRQDQGGLLRDDVRSRGHGRVGAAQAPARSRRAAGSRQPVFGALG